MAKKPAHATTRAGRTGARNGRRPRAGTRNGTRNGRQSGTGGAIQQAAVAMANNDVAQVGWAYEQPIDQCLGFAVYRVDTNTQKREALPAWVGFQGGSNANWTPHTTEEWPVQKFNWRDLTGERGNSYRYEVVPMIGTPGNLKPDVSRKLVTNDVTLTPSAGVNGVNDQSVRAYFNRGILSTQHLAHTLKTGPSGAPSYQELTDRIDQPGDPLRNELAGQILEGMKLLLNRARSEGGTCYAALYELTDPELLQLLLDSKNVLQIILSNTGSTDEENDAARQALHEAGAKITDRMLKNGHIGHNKFMVYLDASKTPRAVLSGSTNWTATAVCGQSNNAIVVESQSLATAYKKYWDRLLADDAEQSSQFRSTNQKTPGDGSDVLAKVWFSPNTRQQNKPANAAEPVDLEDVFDLMKAAQHAILFLVFQPGTPSIVDTAAECLAKNKELFVRGAATVPAVATDFMDTVELFHGSATPDLVVPAGAVTDQFSYWQKELLKSSPNAHAIIHNKIVVIDPFSDQCVVVTGSHNLGYRASYNNDENLLIFSGNRWRAKAYAVHVMDVYDHYRWRFTLKAQGQANAFSGLQTTDAWQTKYFARGKLSSPELAFWMQAAARVQAAGPPAVALAGNGAPAGRNARSRRKPAGARA